MNLIIRAAQMFFLEAMCFGYAMQGGHPVEKTTIVELPRSKVITHQDLDWKLVDCYYTRSDSEKSAGHTTVWYKDQPVWMMSYGGSYPQVVIPFLKKCLRQAYLEGRFYGGRGSEFMEDETFIYTNSFHGTFTSFEGEERIYDKSGTRFGHHRYHGMSLLKG